MRRHSSAFAATAQAGLGALAARTALALATLVAGACASQPAGYSEGDPLEPMNRAIYSFNDFIDKVTLRPLALGYKELMPQPVQQGVANVYSNLLEPANGINGLLQGKPRVAGNAAGRFAINTTVGILGIFDVAGNSSVLAPLGVQGLRRQEEDFAQTLAYWGVPSGPYLVLPFWGPSSLRDGVGLAGDIFTNPMFYFEDSSVADKLLVTRLVDLRATLLALDETIQRSTDPYVFIRSAYRQNRTYMIWDGNPPLDEDLYDEEFDE